ncbi:hypothetical protein JNUCC1_00652 [Lentibacillus sp. JNUCC-1]|uniref:carboxypeptidase regulatory-like domain-containing protein n=1 Tax=Lentibacillus sp. JNUCC-1 TaxID=2654513 RepID=UPI0012E80FBF|nr:carboxypeptidase regulatory-like domain-containing protein [Lentibacillus sp. JNUCC-1]MUV36848.1 hypothetical protein [Lentibacillus sp. JNUCC-1]
MKINIKVKHLILTVLTIMLLVPLVSFVIIPQINLHLTEKRLTDGDGDQVGKDTVMDLLEKPLLQSQKWELIRKSMLDDGPAHRYDVYAGPSFTQTTTDDTSVKFTWNEKLPYIKKYVKEGPVNGFLTTAAKNLAGYYAEQNNWKQADKVLANTAGRFTGDQYDYDKQELSLERVRLAMQSSDLDEADHLMHQMLETIKPDDASMQAEAAEMRARLVLQQGNVKEAYDSIQKALAAYEKSAKEAELYDGDFSVENDLQYEQLQSLEWRLGRLMNEKAAAAVSVSGTVQRANGEPLKHVGVFLREKNVVNQSVSQVEPYQVVTDENGAYTFHGVMPGEYQLFLGFAFDQIDGWTYPVQANDWVNIEGNDDITKDITLQELINIESPVNQTTITGETVEFAWEKVEDAAYYNLSVNIPIDGGSIGRGLKTHITSTATHIAVEELYNQSFNILVGDEEDDMDPIGLLGLANPESRFSWNVEAFDEDGNLITQSNGYRLNEETLGNLPFFYLKTRELTEADHKLLDGDFKGALDGYMAGYEEHPEDMHNVRMIVRLLGMKGDGTIETRDELVFPYVKVLAEKTGAFPYILELLSYYYEQRDWDAFDHWYQRAEHGVSDLEKGVIEALHAKALIRQGEFEAARQAFAEAVPSDLYHSETGNWLAVSLYQGASFADVLKIADDYPEYDSFNKGRPWKQLIVEMQTEAQNRKAAYIETMRTGLELYFKGDNAKLERWLKNTKEPALTEFVEQLGELE